MKRKSIVISERRVDSGPRKAVVYARVSSKDQEKEGFSIPAQLRLLKDYAASNQLHVAKEFVDVETAKAAGRAAFGDMVQYLKATPDSRIVLVEKTDRLYRNFRDYVDLDDLDLEIHLVKEHEVMTKDSGSSKTFMHGIKVLVAKNYIDNLSEETRKGMLQKARAGLWPSAAPLGYLNVLRSDGKRTIQPDPARAPLIRRLFERYAMGNYSIKDVARLARDEGFAFRKSKDPLNVSTAHTILQNRLYTGDFDWDGKTYKGTHEAIVSPELWQQVQDMLARKSRSRHRRAKHNFAFSGLITCGHCGCSIVGEIKKARYVYYHCTGYKGKCPEPYVREEIFEERFAEVLGGLTFDDEIMAAVADALRSSHVDQRRYHEETVTRLQAEYNRLQGRIDAMYVDKLDGRIDAVFFDRKSAEWRSEQERITATIRETQAANQDYLEDGVRLLELARGARGLFERQVPSEKRRLLNFVLSNCTWKDKTLDVTFRQPFDLLADTAESARVSAASDGLFEGLNGRWLLR